MKYFLYFFLLSLTFASCKPVHEEVYICPDYPLNDEDLMTTEDYAIYNAVIDSFYKDQLVHVVQKTSQGTQIKNDTFHTSSGTVVVEFDIIADYNYNNLFAKILGDHFSPNASRISSDEINCFFSFGSDVNISWNNYYEKYPDHIGFVSLSRIGYSMDKTKAILQYNRSCNSLCGSGGVLLMEKIAGNWIVKHKLISWAS